MKGLKEKYEKEVKAQIKKELDIKSDMEVPRVTKVVVNAGIGGFLKNKEGLEDFKKDIAAITGQAASIRAAKISVAGFGLRAGMPVGLKVTLRGSRMYDFLERLFSIVLPRLRDFRGLSPKSFDNEGNYTLGIAEHSVFPEVDPAKVSVPRGLEITIVTSTRDKEVAKRLLGLLGMPFEKEEEKNG